MESHVFFYPLNYYEFLLCPALLQSHCRRRQFLERWRPWVRTNAGTWYGFVPLLPPCDHLLYKCALYLIICGGLFCLSSEIMQLIFSLSVQIFEVGATAPPAHMV